MQGNKRYPFKTAALVFMLLPLIVVCAPSRGPEPAVSPASPSAEQSARAEEIYKGAMDDFRSERWSEAVKGFDLLLDTYPGTKFTSDALVFSTESDLELGNIDRASGRILAFKQYLVEQLGGRTAASGKHQDLLSSILRRYAAAGRWREALDLLMAVVPPDFKPRDLGDEVYDLLKYLSDPLTDEVLSETVAANPGHVLTPYLQVSLAGRALRSGDNEGALALISRIRMRSLRETDRRRAKEIRDEASGKGIESGRVALLLPFTGNYSQYARAVLEGVQLALHLPTGGGGASLGFEVYDTAGGFSSLKGIIDQVSADPGIVAILGPLSSSSTAAASLSLQKKDLTLISPTASEKGLHELCENVYTLNFIDESLATRIAEFAVNDLGLHDFSALFPMDDYGYRMVRAFIERVEELGGRMLVAQGYPISATTFDVELKRIRYYAPEALFIPAHSEEIPMLAPQISFYGLDDVQILGTNGWNNKRVARLGGKYVEGAFFTDSFFEDSPRIAYREFSSRYEKVYHKEASRVAALGFDAMNLIKWGLDRHPGRSRSRAIDFSDLHDYRGATALFSMGEDGYLLKEPLLLTITGGKVRAVGESPVHGWGGEADTTSTPLDPAGGGAE